MKKTILAIALVFSTITASAQFYVSASAGGSLTANEKVLGEKTDVLSGSLNNLKGSYGEGINGNLRIGYFFNKTVGLELGVGYLHGAEQEVNNVVINTSTEVDLLEMNAKARAFGASLSGVFNVTESVYVRLGLLTKIGGKTISETNLDFSTIGTDLQADFTTEFRGKMPLGFVGGLGYRYKLSENLNLFVEAEYMNIGVTRNKSNLEDLTATYLGSQIDAATLSTILATAGYSDLAVLLQEDLQWGENGLPAPKAPYSSIGLNFGVTYSF